MTVFLKEPGCDPQFMDIEDRFFEKLTESVIGPRYERVSFGNGITIIAMQMGESEEKNFKYKIGGRGQTIYGPAIFVSEGESGVEGLNKDQQRVIKGCFRNYIAMSPKDKNISNDDVWSEILDFLALIYDGAEEEIYSRRNMILERNLVCEWGFDELEKHHIEDEYLEVSFRPTATDLYDIMTGEYIGRHSIRRRGLNDDGEADAAGSADLQEERLPDKERADIHEDPSDEVSDELIEDPENEGNLHKVYEEWFTSNLLESAGDSMSDKTKKQIVEVMVDKFNALMESDEDFEALLAGHIGSTMNDGENEKFFNMVTSRLVKKAGVKEEYAKRYPDEYRVQEQEEDHDEEKRK